MPTEKMPSWVDARAIVQQNGRELLILRDSPLADGFWSFPGGRAEKKETPEAALRRHCREALGVELELHIGQPPFVHNFGTHSVTYRYYWAGVLGEPRAAPACELRWVLPGQLREYDFDAPTRQVVEWLQRTSTSD